MQQNTTEAQFYFDDPRLHMTYFGRIFVRVVSYLTYVVFVAGFFTLVFSRVQWLVSLGVLLGLFLVDRFIRRRGGDISIPNLPSASRVNVVGSFTPRAWAIIEHAYDKSVLLKTNFFLETVRQCVSAWEIRDALTRMDVSCEEFRQKADDFLDESAKLDGGAKDDERLKAVSALATNAFLKARSLKHEFVDVGDVFGALPSGGDPTITRLFAAFNIEAGDLSEALLFIAAQKQVRGLRRVPASLGGFVFGADRGLRHRVMNRAWTSRPSPTLDSVSTDLTDIARGEEIGFLIGHEAEYGRLLDVLSRATNPNALLVGEAGIGKEAIVNHFAFEIIKDKVPHQLFDKRLVSLDLSNLVALGGNELQKTIERIVREMENAGNIILYIPDIHNLLKTSGAAYLSAADALIPIIMHGEFPVIGATYPREFKSFIEPRSDFSGAFEAIPVNEISAREAEQILIYESAILERETGVKISFKAVKTAVALAKKYLHDKFLPSSAEELLKEAVARCERDRKKMLDADGVASAAEEKVNIPIHEAKKDEAEALLHLEDTIHERLIDQDEAVKAVSNALREYRSGLSRSGGPIAAFLFVGPTGVGKTELAKILTRVQFGEENAMVRFDMTEYQDKASFERFIGSPNGETRGALTEAIREKPYSLILLDEFEKAHHDILNLFLQVFDDGRLTDNLGRTVDFANTIIIATSNAHSDIINDALSQGQSMSDIADYLKKKLTDVFVPELLNRFSKIIVFKNLSPGDLKSIVVLQLDDLNKSLEAQGIGFNYEEGVVPELAKLGYDPSFGARPLRRVIEEKLRAPLAEKILRHEVGRGGTLTLGYKDDNFEFVSSGSDAVK